MIASTTSSRRVNKPFEPASRHQEVKRLLKQILERSPIWRRGALELKGQGGVLMDSGRTEWAIWHVVSEGEGRVLVVITDENRLESWQHRDGEERLRYVNECNDGMPSVETIEV